MWGLRLAVQRIACSVEQVSQRKGFVLFIEWSVVVTGADGELSRDRC